MGLMLDLPGLLQWWKSLKPGWRWTVGLIPLVVVGLLIGVYALLDRRIIDPTEAADKRATDEEKKRAASLKDAGAKLKAGVETIRQSAVTEDKKDDAASADLAQDLAKDPKKLVDSMRNVGRGGKP
jgi:hypothetical protein